MMVFGWFKKEKPAARVEPSAAKLVPVMAMPDKRYFAREAVVSLGYLKPEAISVIAQMLEDQMVNHPKAIMTAYRKDGEQISDEEKKALGIRKNGFMSRTAMGDLTDKGRTKPLEAHSITLLRATFAMGRVRGIAHANEAGFDEFKYDSIGDGLCPACDALDGKIVKGADALIFPPPECVCETGRYGVNVHVDFLADLRLDN